MRSVHVPSFFGPHFPVFSPNARKCGLEKLQKRTLFMQCLIETVECSCTQLCDGSCPCSAFGLKYTDLCRWEGTSDEYTKEFDDNELSETEMKGMKMMIITVMKFYENMEIIDIVQQTWYFEKNLTNLIELRKCSVFTFSFVALICTYQKWEGLRTFQISCVLAKYYWWNHGLNYLTLFSVRCDRAK